MTDYPIDQIHELPGKIHQWQTEILQLALRWLMDDIEVVPGRARGGSPRRRQIPKHTGELASSLATRLGSEFKRKSQKKWQMERVFPICQKSITIGEYNG